MFLLTIIHVETNRNNYAYLSNSRRSPLYSYFNMQSSMISPHNSLPCEDILSGVDTFPTEEGAGKGIGGAHVRERERARAQTRFTRMKGDARTHSQISQSCERGRDSPLASKPFFCRQTDQAFCETWIDHKKRDSLFA